MIAIFITLLITGMPSDFILFDFSENDKYDGWSITDDVVMGGRSNGRLKISDNGNAIFTGEVSLENNGGFSSLKYQLSPINVSQYQTIILYLKGDGKDYQFRVKSHYTDRHAYVKKLNTTGEWQAIEIELKDMVPTFRGIKLNMPNYPNEKLGEIRFLIGNKKAEKFSLEIDKIVLK